MEISHLDFYSAYCLAMGLCICSHLVLWSCEGSLSDDEYIRIILSHFIKTFSPNNVWFYLCSLGYLVSGS